MLRRRSIRLRIIVLVLVPVLGLLGLYAEVLNLTIGKILTLRQEAQIRQLVALPVANVQKQLTNELGVAVEYLARRNSVGASSVLAAQGKRTERAIAHFNTAVRNALNRGPVPKERRALLSWQANLKTVAGLRSSVVHFGLTKIDAAGAYSSLIEGGDNVLSQAIVPVLSGPLGIQATDLLAMARASQALDEESDLVKADLPARSLPPQDFSVISQLAVLHHVEWAQTFPSLDPPLGDRFVADIPQSAATQLTSLESDLLSGRSGARMVSPRAWTSAETAYQQGFRSALLKNMAALTDEASSQAKHLMMNLLLIAGIGLLAIVAAVVVGVILGRGLIRQLTELRQSAVRLAIEQLPAAIRRLRAGHDVDVGAEVPRLEPGQDEIGQVSEAFNTAARTAIAAAVDEIKIRRGVNGVFRSLARRNQSLLTRQLQLLDTMERRVHDPDELADLFRVDHMTTRMRRHAEGLLIVAGGSSGRTWRAPVPIVDVMRASAAEVEDYTRIKVNSRTSAAIAGHAVAEIIHLLAELLENATTFSPTNTPVRVAGERVGRGVVVEIEDRGLGMSQHQLAEINATLVDPPLFDLAASDQLGLFIAGQLAKRHGVKITLRRSAYGGVTAVVLIPTELVIDVPEADDGLGIAGIRELGGRPIPQLPGPSAEPAITAAAGVAASGQGQGPQLDKRIPAQLSAEPGAHGERQAPGVGSVAASLAAGAAAPVLPARRPGTAGLTWGEAGILAGTWADRTAAPAPTTDVPDQAAPDTADARTEDATSDAAAADTADARTEDATSDATAADTATPAAATTTDRAEMPETEAPVAEAHPADAAQAEASADQAGASTASASAPPDEAPAPAATGAATGSSPSPVSTAEAAEATESESAGRSDLDGLPIRVRQANLAPQLRRSDAPDPAAFSDEPTGIPSPEAARSTMAALQLGWRRGRSASARRNDTPESPAASGPVEDTPESPAASGPVEDTPEFPAGPAGGHDEPAQPPAPSAVGDEIPAPPAAPAEGQDEPANPIAAAAVADDPPESTARTPRRTKRKPRPSVTSRSKASKTSPSPPRPGDDTDGGGSE